MRRAIQLGVRCDPKTQTPAAPPRTVVGFKKGTGLVEPSDSADERKAPPRALVGERRGHFSATALVPVLGSEGKTPATQDAGLDTGLFRGQDLDMSSAAVKRVIDLASELSEDERRVVVDAIAPKESVAALADEWVAEIERRAELVRSGRSEGKLADEVFDRLESKLKAR
jgi:hypothetical protein